MQGRNESDGWRMVGESLESNRVEIKIAEPEKPNDQIKLGYLVKYSRERDKKWRDTEKNRRKCS